MPSLQRIIVKPIDVYLSNKRSRIMKRICLVLILIFCFLHAEEGYMNVNNLSQPKSEHLSNLRKITVGDGVVQFELYNKTVVPEDISNIVNITFKSTADWDNSLPVELTGFRALQNDNDVVLSWETGAEVNNLGFDIERIHKGIKEWEKIGFVEGEGNSSTPTSYSYIDVNVNKLDNLKYRLKQLDFDGAFEYSPVVGITLEKIILPSNFSLDNNYPNPFNPKTTITYEIADENFISMKIFDMQGKELNNLVEQNQLPGKYSVEFDGSDLSSGVYFCRLTSGNDTKLIKMLLLK